VLHKLSFLSQSSEDDQYPLCSLYINGYGTITIG